MLNRRLSRDHARGVSLIELMIGIVLIAVLTLLGIPAFTAYTQNAKLRSTAENFLGGLQRARAEAVQRNGRVEILLTDDDAGGANVNTGALSNTGRTWLIRWTDPNGLYVLLDSRLGQEGAGASGIPTVQVAGDVASVIFDGYGASNAGSAVTFRFTNPAGGSCAPAGPMRCLNVVVSSGGRIRMCDPAVNPITSPTDTRSC